MGFFKNKHIITAMIVAPLLAIGSYYLVDLAVKEKPQLAKEGQAYPLVAQSNCRYTSGSCDLINAEFKTTITIEGVAGVNFLKLKSSRELQGVVLGFISQEGSESAPVSMQPNSPDNLNWTASFDALASDTTIVRLALTANDTHYYAETTLGFSNYQTSFNKDFRK